MDLPVQRERVVLLVLLDQLVQQDLKEMTEILDLLVQLD